MTPAAPDPFDARAIVPETDDILACWARWSDEARSRLPYQSGIETAGCPFDLYRPTRNGAVRPIVIFIHGGYWRGGAASTSGFLAPYLADLGAMTAVPDYPLAPSNRLDHIVAATTDCIMWIAENAGRLGADGSRIVLIGHSAGGHLGAMALARFRECRLPRPRLFVGVSGLYDIVPVNRGVAREWLALSDAEAEAFSPSRHAPAAETTVFLTVGELETEAFKAQSENYRDWASKAGCAVRFEMSPSCNHFNVIHRLFDRQDALTRLVADAVGVETGSGNTAGV